jgi:RNA polymerase sigma-70 factor (ECF subfamily)
MGEILDKGSKFAVLYDEYSPLIYRLAYRWLGNREEASDLTQNVFLKLHLSFQKDVFIENPKTWLYAVAANLCRDSVRRRIKLRRIIKLDWVNRPRSDKPNTEALQPGIAAIKAAMARMPERDRLLLTLYQDDLSYEEIAEISGLKRTSIGKILSRAIKRLADELKNGVQK